MHESSHTRQFEDSKCKYMIKGFSKSDPNLRKCLPTICLPWDEKLLSSSTGLCLIGSWH